MKIHVYASGSTGNLYEIQDGEERLLIEAGMTWSRVQEALDYTTSGLRAVLCSHEHGDHAAGLGGAIHHGMDCYMSQGTADALGLSGPLVHVLTPEEPEELGPWTIWPYRVEHDAAEPLCFYIVTPSGNRVLYVTDAARIPQNFAGVTHMMVESNWDEGTLQRSVKEGRVRPVSRANRIRHNHIGLNTLMKALHHLDLSDLQEVILLHISKHNANIELIGDQVRRLTGCPVRVACN